MLLFVAVQLIIKIYA